MKRLHNKKDIFKKKVTQEFSFRSVLVGIKTTYFKPFYFVLVLCGIILLSHTLYVLKTYSYPIWDEYRYLGAAIHFLPILSHPNSHFLANMSIQQNRWLPSAPPLYPLLLDIPLLIFGTMFTYKISMWINVIFYIATILGIYFLGKEFFSKKVSAITAFIFAFYGFPLFYLHFVYTETAGTAFTVLSLCFLTKTNYFKKTKYVALFALFAALAVLTRWTTPLFILGPFLIVLLTSIKNSSKENRTSIIKNILVLCAICTIPLIAYYVPNHEAFLSYLKSGSANGASWMPGYLRNPFSGHSFIWYISIIAEQTVFFYLLFLISFFLSLVYFKKYAFLLGAFIIPFIFFTFFSTFKDDRFIVPLYPSIALLSGVFLDFVENKKWRIFVNTLIMLTVIIGFFNFLGASWGVGPMRFSASGSVNKFTLPNSILVPMPIGHPRRVWLAPISWPPRPDEGKADLIINTILADWHGNKSPQMLFTFEMTQVNTAIDSKILFEKLGSITENNIDAIESGDFATFFRRIDNSDYILVKDGIVDHGYEKGKYKDWDAFIIFVRLFNDLRRGNKDLLPRAFTPVKNVYIPFDKSTLIIYKKQRGITVDEWREFGDSLKKIDTQHAEAIDYAVQQMSQR